MHRVSLVHPVVRPAVWLRERALGFLVLNIAFIHGCIQPDPKEPASASASLTRTEEILDRCIAAYERMSTLQATGVLSDFRHGGRRVVPISWDLARPARCRLQIERDVVIVHGADCWVYRAATGRFQGSRTTSVTPIESDVAMVSDGVPFLLPSLWENRKAALGRDPIRGFAGWRLQGVSWSGDRPCYMVVRKSASGVRGNLLRLWIDQDLLIIRRWALVEASEDERETTIVECAYHSIVINKTLPLNRFQLQPPEPIGLPRSAAGAGPVADGNSLAPREASKAR